MIKIKTTKQKTLQQQQHIHSNVKENKFKHKNNLICFLMFVLRYIISYHMF